MLLKNDGNSDTTPSVTQAKYINKKSNREDDTFLELTPNLCEPVTAGGRGAGRSRDLDFSFVSMVLD